MVITAQDGSGVYLENSMLDGIAIEKSILPFSRRYKVIATSSVNESISVELGTYFSIEFANHVYHELIENMENNTKHYRMPFEKEKGNRISEYSMKG